MSSPKQTTSTPDESAITTTLTTISAGQSAAQATSSAIPQPDLNPASTTTDPAMATTASPDAPVATPTAHHHDIPSHIAELPADSSPRPSQLTTTIPHLQPPTSTVLSSSLPPQPETGLGPATDAPLPITTSSTTTALLTLTLLLPTGARHPYTLDEKYLRSRKVSTTFDAATGACDPRLLSGYQLKELIWIDWRAEWEPRPANPSFIRLIVMGRMVEDKGVLKDYPLTLAASNVVHMTVKPADLFDDDDAHGAGKHAKQGAGFRRGGGSRGERGGEAGNEEDGEGGAGCRCVIL